jgi:hypothetical protein
MLVRFGCAGLEPISDTNIVPEGEACFSIANPANFCGCRKVAADDQDGGARWRQFVSLDERAGRGNISNADRKALGRRPGAD